MTRRTEEHDRAVPYLLHKDANLSAKCQDLEARARRNNSRIYGVKEGSEKNTMIPFISELLRTLLLLPEELEVRIERAHRVLTMRPKDASAPLRSIIVRFLD